MGDKAGKTTIAQLIVRTLRKVSFRCDTPEPGVLTVAIANYLACDRKSK